MTVTRPVGNGYGDGYGNGYGSGGRLRLRLQCACGRVMQTLGVPGGSGCKPRRTPGCESRVISSAAARMDVHVTASGVIEDSSAAASVTMCGGRVPADNGRQWRNGFLTAPHLPGYRVRGLPIAAGIKPGPLN